VTSDGHPVCLLLVDGAWGSPLHAMRSLRERGVATYVVAAGSGAAILGRSRYCAGAIDLDASDPVEFVRAAVSWLGRQHPRGPVVVLPLSDRMVSFVDEGRDRLADRFLIAAPPPELTRMLVDKSLSFRLAEQVGMDVPAWTSVAGADDLPGALTLRLPVVVRPSSWATVGEEYFKVAVHHDRSALEADLRSKLASGARLVVQEYLDVPEDAVEFGIVWRSLDGSVTAVCTGRKRRQAGADGGVMVWGEAVPLPDVNEEAVRFLDGSGFTGLGGIEFIRDRGRLRFIEFNPRLEAIHFLAKAAGVDTLPMAVRDLMGATPAVPGGPQRRAAAWIGSAWLGRFLADPSARGMLLHDRIRFARSPNRVRAVWSWSDPLPGLALTLRLIVGMARRLRGGHPPREGGG
jgi:predicted ATP-grasp superfamily ATP-dependent carboligase